MKPAAADTIATSTSGTAASSTTTRRRCASGMPVRRSSVNGRLRSIRPPATDTARLQPAMTRLRMMPTSTMRCSRLMSARD